MARTLTEIYTVAKNYRNQYLELTEFQNSSKMSVIDAFTWVTSACIWTFENILDVFKVDLAKDLQNRINGNAAYYANALLKYQSGDELEMNEEGTAFSYPTIDETKRVITRVSYSEYQEEGFYDKQLMLKIATGEPGAYERVSDEELLAIRAYFNQIAFAGTHATIVSRKGDVLVPRVTVYYDGAISEEEVYKNIEDALNNFIANVSFDGVIYTQKIIDAIQRAEHVVDVHISTIASDLQGIFIAQYDDDNNLIPVQYGDGGEVLSYEHKVDRCFVPNSGFLKQSSRSGDEETLLTWKEAITLKIEE
jgi:hypothetical protein